jgi:hypothetical protein
VTRLLRSSSYLNLGWICRHPQNVAVASTSARAGRVSRLRSLAPAVLVWVIWAATLASILGSIVRYGRNIPFEEDWLMVAPMTGHEPDLARWLWSQNSEHRLPLPRLINLALLRTTGDFRSTMVFDALAVGAVAAAMILVARALRNGYTGAADAFFPLLLLHLGNWDNLVWGWQIQFVLPTVLACVLLLIIVARATPPTPGVTAAGALALIGLPLSGANGLVFAPPLAAWFGYTGWLRHRGSPADLGLSSWVAIGAAALTAMLCLGYFIGFQSSPWNAPSPGLLATLKTSGKFLALSLGPAAARAWLPFLVLVSVVLLASLGVLAVAWRRRDGERLRIAGLLAFFVAVAVLAVAVGWGRAGRVAATGRMPTRYVLLAAPGLCAAYFTLLLFGQRWIRRAAPAALAALLALLFPINTRIGLQRRDWFGAGMSAFERDLDLGVPSTLLSQRHHAFLLHWDEALMRSSMRMLREARIGPFVRLPRE